MTGAAMAETTARLNPNYRLDLMAHCHKTLILDADGCATAA